MKQKYFLYYIINVYILYYKWSNEIYIFIIFTKYSQLTLLFDKAALNWSKVSVKHLCYKRFLFQINAVLLKFLFINESWKI